MSTVRPGDREVISVGDIGDVFEADTKSDLTGFQTLEIVLERNDPTLGWVQVVKLTATLLGLVTAGVIEGTTVAPSPFTTLGEHSARALVTFTDGSRKLGDAHPFFVHRGEAP